MKNWQIHEIHIAHAFGFGAGIVAAHKVFFMFAQNPLRILVN